MSARQPPLTALHALFADVRCVSQPVCDDGKRLILWGEFAAHVVRLVTVMRQLDGARCLLAAADPLRFVAGLLALLNAGKQVVVPPNTLPATLAALAKVCDARFDDDDLAFVAASPQAVCLPAIDPQAAIIDLYTSGSTGEHKRVRKTLAQFEAEVAVLEALWGETIGRAAMIATAPHQHIYGLLFRLFWPLASARVFDAQTCAHPDLLEQRLRHFGHAALVSSPAQLTRLPELLTLAALSPRPVAVFSSGGPLPARAAHALHAGLGQAPLEVFGSTETGGVAWRQQDGGEGDWWTPFPGHRVGRSGEGALTLRSPFLPGTQALVMDDGVELRADGRFRLLGRLDRVVKIEEKRLSLPEMEACLEAHRWVEAAALVALAGRRQSIGALLVLSDSGRAQLAGAGRRALTQTLHRHLAGHFEAVLLPRYWRFADRLPVNERGKLAPAVLAGLFARSRAPTPAMASDGPRLLPDVTGVIVDGDGARWQADLDLHVVAQLAHFAGHFPGAALLPGVVQVDWAMHFARGNLPVDGDFLALEKLKFLAVITPGTRLQLRLIWDAERRTLDFSYAGAACKYSAGRIVFGDAS